MFFYKNIIVLKIKIYQKTEFLILMNKFLGFQILFKYI